MNRFGSKIKWQKLFSLPWFIFVVLPPCICGKFRKLRSCWSSFTIKCSKRKSRCLPTTYLEFVCLKIWWVDAMVGVSWQQLLQHAALHCFCLCCQCHPIFYCCCCHPFLRLLLLLFSTAASAATLFYCCCCCCCCHSFLLLPLLPLLPPFSAAAATFFYCCCCHPFLLLLLCSAAPCTATFPLLHLVELRCNRILPTAATTLRTIFLMRKQQLGRTAWKRSLEEQLGRSGSASKNSSPVSAFAFGSLLAQLAWDASRRINHKFGVYDDNNNVSSQLAPSTR